MNGNDLPDDPLLRALAELPTEDASPARTARVRARCHAELARARRPGAALVVLATGLCRRLLEPALISALGTVYLIEVVRRAVALLGL